MSASPVESVQSACARIAFRYLSATVLCAVFGAVYEAFSHEVYAYGMLYAFAIPLLGGVFPVLLIALKGIRLPSGVSMQLWHFGISALTVGSLFSGALAIYGTTSRLTSVYWLAGGMCMLLSVLTGLFLPAQTGNAIDRRPPLFQETVPERGMPQYAAEAAKTPELNAAALRSAESPSCRRSASCTENRRESREYGKER